MEIGEAGHEKDDADMGKLLKMKLEEVSATTMEALVDAASSSAGLSAFSYVEFEDDGDKQESKEITTEKEATVAAHHIFHSTVKCGSMYIEKEDLLRFIMTMEEVELGLLLIDVAETGKIDKRASTDWMMKVYNACKGINS